MKTYRIKWTIQLDKTIKAKKKVNAIIIAENIDCQHDGDYVENSWKLVAVDEIK